MSNSIGAVLAHVEERLKFVAPIFYGKRLKDANGAPPLYRILLGKVRHTSPGAIGGNPRLLHNRAQALEVHAWGRDVADAELLMQAFITALREAVAGANYAIGEGDWIEGSVDAVGDVLAVQFLVTIGVPEATLPTSPTAVEDAVAPTWTPTEDAQLDIADTTGSAQGDGNLDAGET